MSRHVHLVGSLNLPSTEAVFTTVGQTLGDRITRVPDGEVGERANWSEWQMEQLQANDAFMEGSATPFGALMRLRDAEAIDSVEVPPPGYAAHAVRSYAQFRELREHGKLPSSARFLVALPTPFAWLGYVDFDHKAIVEPLLERAMLTDLHAILDAIPAEDLAIQWDVSNEIGALEEIEPVHFDNILEGCAERLARIIDEVPTDVQVGMHLCYGSYDDKHFVEPKDMSWMIQLFNETAARASRKLTYIHMPVPIERDDPDYFAPLAELHRDRVDEVYLGLVHREDGIEGSARRIAAARTVIDDFGVATECGFARLEEAEMVPLLELQARTADLDAAPSLEQPRA